MLRSFSTLVVGFNLLSVNFKYVLVSFNKTTTFSLHSSLSSTTMDLPLSAGRTFTVSSFVRLCSAMSCSFVMLTACRGYFTVLKNVRNKKAHCVFCRLVETEMPFSTEDKFFATGIFFEAMQKLKQAFFEGCNFNRTQSAL